MISRQELEQKNKWWKEPKYQIKESVWPKRELFQVITDNLSHTLMLNIVGLRRVGKSTILRQLINKLLQDKVNPENIFYYLFDYSSQIKTPVFLDEVLSVYFNEILRQNYLDLQEKIYIILDEIQYIENWQSILKKYYDLSGKMIKFIVTGSQSVLLKGKYRESLAGRIFDYYLPPLSFREFLIINKETIEQPEKFDLFNLKNDYSNLYRYNVYAQNELITLSREYLITGQFPESRQIGSSENRHEYIMEAVIGKVLEDCIHIFNINKTENFKLVTYQLLNNIGSIFEVTNIGREIAIVRPTLDKYIEYLKESYIIEILYKYHKSLIKGGKITKKLYTPCVNFTCAINHYKESHINEVPEAFGKIVENIIYNVLSLKYKEKTLINNISFYRQRNKEIDFLICKNQKILPIEVKFTNTINLKNLKVLTDYVAHKKLEYGVVISKNELDRKKINGQTIYYIPYYLVLLMI
ncbi:MAG: ATP-binding protein [Patescibacteria group bacterium]